MEKLTFPGFHHSHCAQRPSLDDFDSLKEKWSLVRDRQHQNSKLLLKS